MEIVICALLAYLLSGVLQVIKDLGASAIDSPRWTMKPTPGKAILVAFTWPSRPVLEAGNLSGQFARSVAFGLLSVVLQMSALTAFILASYAIAGLVFANFVLQILLTAVIAFIGSFFVLPLLGLIMVPLTLLLAWPLDLLFPLKSESLAEDIHWCRTCKHHRKVEEYEDTMKGLWREESMPRSDKLPCKIVLETSPVWEDYYDTEPKSRTLFPKDCLFYERQA